MDKKKVAGELVRLAKSLVARYVYDFQSMRGGVSKVSGSARNDDMSGAELRKYWEMMDAEGIDDAWVPPAVKTVTVGFYSGGGSDEWVSERVEGDAKAEAREDEAKISREIAAAAKKFDVEVAKIMKKHGYSQKA
jgi:hypothetical protein